MTTNLSTPESPPRKRQRRIKQDPQFIFETSTTTTDNSTKPIKPKSVDEHPTNSTDLYQPGDIVWSKLGSFPWWPALIFRCNPEGGIYTRTLQSNHKSKRQYFVYFYGKYLEYAWLSTRSLLKYAGLNSFIENAELAVQKASTKSEKLELANRYQLKVSMKKRPQWDEAIELADRALKMTKDERIQQFHDLLNDSRPNIKRMKKDDEQPVKKKRGRKPKLHLKTVNKSNDSEIEYEYRPNINNHQISIPPLSNFELKQIVQGLLNHPDEQTFTFDQAQSFAINKAIEIVDENFNYRLNEISPEWFYESILLKYPSVVFKYHHWFDDIKPERIPDINDLIQVKQWQVALMIQAQMKVNQ